MSRESPAVRLAAFDLDGTLLRGSTVCESLAERLGRLPRMREMERLHNLDEIRAAREEMLTWYGWPPEALCVHLADVRIAPGAAEAFESLAQRGIQTAIVSITWSFAVAWFARRSATSFAPRRS